MKFSLLIIDVISTFFLEWQPFYNSKFNTFIEKYIHLYCFFIQTQTITMALMAITRSLVQSCHCQDFYLEIEMNS